MRGWNVSAYIYESPAETREACELKSITLRLIDLAQHGKQGNLLDLAANLCGLGRNFEHWRMRNLERLMRMDYEIRSTIPDYDPTEDRRRLLDMADQVSARNYPKRTGTKDRNLQGSHLRHGMRKDSTT